MKTEREAKVGTRWRDSFVPTPFLCDFAPLRQKAAAGGLESESDVSEMMIAKWVAAERQASTAFAIAGLGSIFGLAAGAHMTRNYDRDKDFASYPLKSGRALWSVTPQVSLIKHPFRAAQVMPAIILRSSF